MSLSSAAPARLLNIYRSLSSYPILCDHIREQMRQELFDRHIITQDDFEEEITRQAVASQQREGLTNPLIEEGASAWELRLERIRAHYTDLLFSQLIPLEVFEEIVARVLGESGISRQPTLISTNPELATLAQVFEQARSIEALPTSERSKYQARLQETKVVLIRTLISDQLRYIRIAKSRFTVADLEEIRKRKIGSGRIGGKAGGMLLAQRILAELGDEHIKASLHNPESFYIGANELYNFMSVNDLVHWNDQKYKTEAEIRAEYPLIVKDFEAGVFLPSINERLRELLEHPEVHNKPLIVRSSSLLEDSFGTAFPGKYESFFVPNQSSTQKNLEDLKRAIANVYASTLNPDALLYRQARGLTDYDERMAVLIQVVRGERYGHYLLPHAAGVAFSHNLYRWAPQIRREEGFIRLVWGLGTRAVDRVGNDFPRLIALSHPTLRPSTDPKNIRRYSQQYVDLIDLEDNCFKTLPVAEVLRWRYPPLRYIAQLDEEGDFVSLRTNIAPQDPSRLVLTFNDLLQRTPFAELMRSVLKLLSQVYESQVDVEFTLHIHEGRAGRPELKLDILQCRPQSRLTATEQHPLPFNLPPEDVIFSTHFVVPQGYISRVDYVLFVPPEGYFRLPDEISRRELGQTIGRLNAALAGQSFICIGPGRWGSANSDLGVPIAYGDIYNTRALVEVSGQGIGPDPEPSLGTHFFQDLLESQIYPLAVHLGDKDTILNREFLYGTPSCAGEWISLTERMANSLRLIRVTDFRPASYLRVIMNDEKSLAVAFIWQDEE